MTRENSRNGAILLIVLGLMFLLSEAGIDVWRVFELVNWNLVWPALLIAAGMSLLLRRSSQA